MTSPDAKKLMIEPNKSQKAAFEANFDSGLERWAFHDTKDPLTRFLRDRRLNIALQYLAFILPPPIKQYSVLAVCGGVGGEATYFKKRGFQSVTNSDFSTNALKTCNKRDSSLQTIQIDAEAIHLPDASYDIVVVQDGLHHLPRPVLGLNEMIRVAKRAVIVLEPHAGIVAGLIGTKWERQGDAVNFVFRWNKLLFSQVIQSQLLQGGYTVRVIRLWDHGSLVDKIVKPLGKGKASLCFAELIYAALNPLNLIGNNFIGVLVKETPANE